MNMQFILLLHLFPTFYWTYCSDIFIYWHVINIAVFTSIFKMFICIAHIIGEAILSRIRIFQMITLLVSNCDWEACPWNLFLEVEKHFFAQKLAKVGDQSRKSAEDLLHGKKQQRWSQVSGGIQLTFKVLGFLISLSYQKDRRLFNMAPWENQEWSFKMSLSQASRL